MRTATYAGNHQAVVFWLGILTGALVVGFAFFYGMMKMQQYQTAVYRAQLYKATSVSTTLPNAVLKSPVINKTSVPPVNTKAIGGDGGGY